MSTGGRPISTMFGSTRPPPAFALTPTSAQAHVQPAPSSGNYYRASDVHHRGINTKFGTKFQLPLPTDRTVSRATESFQVPMRQPMRQPQTRPPVSSKPESDESDDDNDNDNDRDNDLEPGEEFTPDEQLQLAQEMENDRKLAKAREKPMSRNQVRGTFGTATLALVVVLLGAYLSWYRQEKVAAGYCGLGTRSVSRLVPQEWPIPDWAVPIVEPQCQDCPSHAICYDNLVARCESDFVLKPHPLSLGGLVPVAPSCEPDGARARKIKAVADKAVEELRERRARWECGNLYDDHGKRETTPRIEVGQLKEQVASRRSKRISAEEFEDLWVAALGEVKARDEVEQTVDQ